MARASQMVLDYGSLNKKWIGGTTVSHGHVTLLACLVGTVLMGGGLVLSPSALQLNPFLVVNAFYLLLLSQDLQKAVTY